MKIEERRSKVREATEKEPIKEGRIVEGQCCEAAEYAGDGRGGQEGGINMDGLKVLMAVVVIAGMAHDVEHQIEV